MSDSSHHDDDGTQSTSQGDQPSRFDDDEDAMSLDQLFEQGVSEIGEVSEFHADTSTKPATVTDVGASFQDPLQSDLGSAGSSVEGRVTMVDGIVPMTANEQAVWLERRASQKRREETTTEQQDTRPDRRARVDDDDTQESWGNKSTGNRQRGWSSQSLTATGGDLGDRSKSGDEPATTNWDSLSPDKRQAIREMLEEFEQENKGHDEKEKTSWPGRKADDQGSKQGWLSSIQSKLPTFSTVATYGLAAAGMSLAYSLCSKKLREREIDWLCRMSERSTSEDKK